jgi:hypothetical protein
MICTQRKYCLKERKHMTTGTDFSDEVEKYLNVRPETVTVHEDVSDFFSISRGDIILIDGRDYLVSGTAREKSFGIDDEPKHWVKYTYDLSTGERKIIKLVFLEQFDMKYGDCVIRCFRSPAKEGRALDVVRGHRHFMQGHTIDTGAEGEIRIIEYIKGKTLFDEIETIRRPHEAYFHESLPSLLKLFIPCLHALDFLHGTGLRHGDVRTDHLILDRDSGQLRWIDFDYDFVFREAPYAVDLLGIGNIVCDLIAKGESNIHNLRCDSGLAGALEKLEPGDFSIVEPSRLMNWRKLYPYVPEELNRVLMFFSAGAELYYESAAEVAEDLQGALASMSS